jgi:hypothetical protein
VSIQSQSSIFDTIQNEEIKATWPSGLRRYVQVVFMLMARVQIPQLSNFLFFGLTFSGALTLLTTCRFRLLSNLPNRNPHQLLGVAALAGDEACAGTE